MLFFSCPSLRGLPSLGMPCHRGSGSHLVKGEKYRFLVMDRFGSDLQKIFQTGEKLIVALTVDQFFLLL